MQIAIWIAAAVGILDIMGIIYIHRKVASPKVSPDDKDGLAWLGLLLYFVLAIDGVVLVILLAMS